MIFQDIEQSVQSRISSSIEELELTGITVSLLPETEAQFVKAVESASITVAVVGAEATDHRSISSVVQYVNVRIEVVLQSRRIRRTQYPAQGQDVSYPIFELERVVRNSLIGFRPGGGATEGLKYTQFQHNSFAEGVWSYSVYFECKCTIIQEVLESPVGAPLLKQVSFEEPD